LGLFLLGPLERLPPAIDPVDTYPWRFSRERSSLRRPLFARPTEGDLEIVWGPRSVYRCSNYLLGQIASARLKAKSVEMKRYIASVRHVQNDDFNREVAGLYRRAGYDVRENVRRIGTLRLRRLNGQDIGDIDVLVVSTTRRCFLRSR
jgi:hypothetical protein